MQPSCAHASGTAPCHELPAYPAPPPRKRETSRHRRFAAHLVTLKHQSREAHEVLLALVGLRVRARVAATAVWGWQAAGAGGAARKAMPTPSIPAGGRASPPPPPNKARRTLPWRLKHSVCSWIMASSDPLRLPSLKATVRGGQNRIQGGEGRRSEAARSRVMDERVGSIGDSHTCLPVFCADSQGFAGVHKGTTGLLPHFPPCGRPAPPCGCVHPSLHRAGPGRLRRGRGDADDYFQ